jgi:ribosomal protein S27E
MTPQIGDITKGRNIGKNELTGNYIWVSCVECGKRRWVQFRNGQPVSARCLSCGTKRGGALLTRERNGNWTGGVRLHGDGYIEVLLLRDDPFYAMANHDGYVMEHRLVMARYVGHTLKKEEVVHHINSDRTDNRIENLLLFPNKWNHLQFHQRLKKQGATRC